MIERRKGEIRLSASDLNWRAKKRLFLHGFCPSERGGKKEKNTTHNPYSISTN